MDLGFAPDLTALETFFILNPNFSKRVNVIKHFIILYTIVAYIESTV